MTEAEDDITFDKLDQIVFSEKMEFGIIMQMKIQIRLVFHSMDVDFEFYECDMNVYGPRNRTRTRNKFQKIMSVFHLLSKKGASNHTVMIISEFINDFFKKNLTQLLLKSEYIPTRLLQKKPKYDNSRAILLACCLKNVGTIRDVADYIQKMVLFFEHFVDFV